MNPLKAFTLPEYLFRPSQILVRLKRGLGPAPREFETIDMPWGAKLLVRPAEAIGTRLWYYGIFDTEVAELIVRLLDEGETALDVGANIGVMTTLMCSKVGKKGKVFAFEPHPEVFQELRKNVSSTDGYEPSRVFLHQAGLSDKPGQAVLEEGSGWAGNRGLGKIVSAHSPVAGASLPVKLEAIDAMFGAEWRCDVCKVDVEGHELQVFQGAEAVLSSGRIRDIIFEDLGQYPTVVQLLLRKYGYTLFSVHKRLFGPQLALLNRQPNFNVGVEGENFLATRQPDRAMERCSAKGWQVLSRKW